MIDLRKRELQDTIESGGVTYPIDTDFRTWIEFDHVYRTEGVVLFKIFPKKRPPLSDSGWVVPALEFLGNANATPRDIGRRQACRSLDMVLDGEYIVASFQHAYGIDLTSCDYMHWHRFKALLQGLPDDTKMAKIMAHRTWNRSDYRKKHEAACEELKRAWALPEEVDEAAMRMAKAVAEAWYDEQNGGGHVG